MPESRPTLPSLNRASSNITGPVIWTILLISLGIHALSLVLGKTVLHDTRWANLAVHAAVEMSGSLIALLVVWMLLILEQRGEGTSFNIPIAGAMIAMGILDGCHAVTSAGNTFVWLHSIATFAGGALFALVWVSPSKWSPWLKRRFCPAIFTVSLFVGILPLSNPDLAPSMLRQGEFTPLAKLLNILGGVGLFLAAIRLVLTYRKTNKVDDLLFCLHCVLFGAAAIMFEQSAIWDVPWWGWHLLRLMAYGVALGLIVLTEIRAQRLLIQTTRELTEMTETLEARVEERTSELQRKNVELESAQKELIKARDEAETANRAKSEFLANMSHEIRTPLNAVIGLTEIVMKTELNDSQREHLGIVVDSAESLLSIINDILDFSKIEAGKLELEKVAFHLPDLVGDTLKSLALRAEENEVELVCFIEPSLPAYWRGDPSRLRQLLTNLVGNAIKFTKQGEVVVRVASVQQTEADPTSASQLRFTVRDTGIGIEPEVLDRLFEPFVQADTSTVRRFGGTGLGLSICSRLVQLMNGRIGAESVPGDGSTFHFTVQLEIAPEQDERSWSRSDFKDLRVLIVDDNPTNRVILKETIEPKGMTAVLADSADAAVQVLERDNAFELLLSDFHMPERDGYDLIKEVRQDKRFDNLKIVMLSSASGPDDPKRCEELNIAARLVKPVKQSELFEVLSRVLEIRLHVKEKPKPESAPIPQLPPLRILLVEDSKTNQTIAKAILKSQKHTVIIANNGQEAVDILEQEEFDVVLMDVSMPVMDGYEATRVIRNKEQGTGRRLPIIAMTAHAMQGDREQCLKAGMDDYVTKPVRRPQLYAALARTLGQESE